MPVPIALVYNSLPPYRVAFQRRIEQELPEVTAHVLLTHEVSNSPWKVRADCGFEWLSFGPGEGTAQQGCWLHAGREWRKGGRIIEWLGQHRIAAVVLMGYNDAGRVRILRWCRRHGVPCLVFGDSNVRGDVEGGPRAWAKRLLLKHILASCTGILTCGSLGREYFEKYGVPANRIFLCPYEPDYAAIRELPAEALERAAGRWGLARERRRVLFCARLAPVKRPDLALAAFAAVADQRPDWDLVVVGDGPLAPPLREGLPDRLRGRVVWTGFVDDQRTVGALHRLCDVLVLPSDREPWGVVVNEAAAAGLALLCSSAVGAAAELVREGVNGYVFPTGDREALVRGLLETTRAPEVTERLKAGSGQVLEDWRRRADPVAGLREALRYAGVLGTA